MTTPKHLKGLITEKEFNLSENRKRMNFTSDPEIQFFFYEKDVKEFIKRLKERYSKICEIEKLDKYWVLNPINQLAGNKLI